MCDRERKGGVVEFGVGIGIGVLGMVWLYSVWYGKRRYEVITSIFRFEKKNMEMVYGI